MKKIIVYGAGEFGTLIANVISYIEKYTIGAYGDDDPIKSGTFIDGLPSLWTRRFTILCKKE
jgi:FlaA1/EpsC-like NDP-sugar epimerase